MTIIRAPRPASGFSMVDHERLRDGTMSRNAICLLLQMLSHTDGWRTDSVSLAASGLEGRDAVRSMLRELEAHKFLRRVKRRTAKGYWTWTTYVFDQPATDEDLEALIGGPAPDPDEVTPGADDGGLDDNDWSQEWTNPQVSPWTGNPAPDSPAPGQPSTDSQAIRDRRSKKKKGGAVPAQPHQAREAAKPPTNIDRIQPPEFSTTEPSGGTGSQGRELDAGQTSYDQHGRTTPRCDRHLTSTTDDPCRACGDARVEFQAAQKARDEDLARARAVEARRQWAQEAGNAPKPPDFWEQASAS